MTNRARAAGILLAAGAALGMGRRPPAATEKRAMTIQEWKGQQGGPAAPGDRVAADEVAWAAAWRELGRDAPAVDFKTSVAVIVHVGQRPTGGYSVVFEPLPRGDDLLVRYRIAKPSGFATQAFTQPWAARVFARPKGRTIAERVPE